MSVYDYVRNNFWMKVFALALAVLIYFAVQSVLLEDPSLIWNPLGRDDSREFSSIPVRLVINADQGQGFKVDPPTVNVLLAGEKTALDRFNEAKILIYARVDIAKAPLGSFPLEALPIKGFTIESIQPSRVEIETIPTGVMLFPSPPPVAPAPLATNKAGVTNQNLSTATSTNQPPSE